MTRKNVKFAYCIDTEEIVFENGNKVQLKDLVSDYLFPKDATTKENLTVEQIKWERDVAIEQLKELGYGLGEKIRADEDCISREYILSKAHCCCDDLADDEPCCVDVDDIKNAPSVQPKPKTGHWIPDVDRWGDVVTTVNGYRCSECGDFNTDNDNYCPNCGAKMESEG